MQIHFLHNKHLPTVLFRFLFLLCFLTSASVLAGCDSSLLRISIDKCDDDPSYPGCDDPDGSLDGSDANTDGGDAGDCPQGCSGGTPHCLASTDECVACTENAHCADAMASVCDTATHTCVACTENPDCAHLTGLGICNSGTCVACTVDDESTCNGNSCNPATNACTTTPTNSVDICGACIADSECEGTDTYCVPMELRLMSQPIEQVGSYCLQKIPDTLICPQVFKTPISRTTVSGQTSLTFCGIAEELTTCPAVLELVNPPGNPMCTTSDECGIEGLDDGVCNVVLGSGMVCTYNCSLDDHCPTGVDCPIGGGYCGQP